MLHVKRRRGGGGGRGQTRRHIEPMMLASPQQGYDLVSVKVLPPAGNPGPHSRQSITTGNLT